MRCRIRVTQQTGHAELCPGLVDTEAGQDAPVPASKALLAMCRFYAKRRCRTVANRARLDTRVDLRIDMGYGDCAVMASSAGAAGGRGVPGGCILQHRRPIGLLGSCAMANRAIVDDTGEPDSAVIMPRAINGECATSDNARQIRAHVQLVDDTLQVYRCRRHFSGGSVNGSRGGIKSILVVASDTVLGRIALMQLDATVARSVAGVLGHDIAGFSFPRRVCERHKIIDCIEFVVDGGCSACGGLAELHANAVRLPPIEADRGLAGVGESSIRQRGHGRSRVSPCDAST